MSKRIGGSGAGALRGWYGEERMSKRIGASGGEWGGIERMVRGRENE